MKDIVPDYMTALVGYRAWNVTPEGYLTSINQDIGEPWPSRERKRAVCRAMKTRLRGFSQHVVYTTSISMTPYALQATVDVFERVWERRKAEREAKNHHSPMPHCTCGIYAAKSDQSLHYINYAGGALVWGEVYLWGKIQDYTDGYRAEFAYPKSLKTRHSDLAAKLAERYGVPCEVVEVQGWWDSDDEQPSLIQPVSMRRAFASWSKKTLLESWSKAIELTSIKAS